MNGSVHPSCDGLEFLDVLQECGKHLLKKPPDVVSARLLIEPFVGCTTFTSKREPKHPQQDATMRQMLLMTLGDIAYYEKKPEEAAKYYRSAFLLDGRFLVADMYARVVVENNLVDHYSSASNAVHQSQMNSKQMSLTLRFIGCVYWFLFYLIPHPQLWKWWRDGRRFCKEVERRALTGGHEWRM